MSIFQQNREKWQKRASTTSADATYLAQVNQPQSAILTRNRLQPDLVMDLPPPSQQDNTTPPLSSGSTSASSSMTSLDKHVEDTEEDAEMTLGDHFAKQNQSTLKKNEKFQDLPHKKMEKSTSSSSSDSTKINNRDSIEDVVLRIEEAHEIDGSRLSTGSNKSTSSLKIDAEKSPIPNRNTQKFVSQFADLKLTGGCSTTVKTATTPTNPLMTQPEKTEKDRASFTFGSFKPTISVKPHVLNKKKSIFLQTHSSPSPSTSPGPSESDGPQ